MRFSVVTFPGSNCDRDCYHVIDQVLRQPVSYVWHTAGTLPETDCVILPGGFSYGDYLRAGAISAHSPVMEAVREFAGDGGLVLGICNGFQVLCETGLLPGALMVNDHLRFACHYTWLTVTDPDTPFTYGMRRGDLLRVPIAHHQGNYRPDDGVRPRISLQYCSSDGTVTGASNPNGSWNSVAAICNDEGNVMGIMPHPERCSEEVLKATDGRRILQSMVHWWGEVHCHE